MHKIYIVEDEVDLGNLIKSYLEKEGYEAFLFSKGTDAITHINDDVHLWILDIMLNDDVNGYDIIKKIREADNNIPVIFTSARDKDIDKILGLEMGGDDYVSKPYSIKELVLRINKIINRVYKKNVVKVSYESYEINKNFRIVKENDEEIKLTSTEFDLLMFLLNNKNIVFSREDIISNVWKDEYFGSDRAVDDLVRRVRKKMPKLRIETVYGYGYKLL